MVLIHHCWCTHWGWCGVPASRACPLWDSRWSGRCVTVVTHSVWPWARDAIQWGRLQEGRGSVCEHGCLLQIRCSGAEGPD